MDKQEFLFLMYFEFGIVPELTERYIKHITDFENVDRHDLAITIQARN